MPIQSPTADAVLDDRLALLEDPILAEQLAGENPALYTRRLADERDWEKPSASGRFQTLALAVVASISLVAGFFVFPMAFKHDAPRATAAPVRHAVAAPAHPQARHDADAALRERLAQQERELAQLRKKIAAQEAAAKHAAAARPAAPAVVPLHHGAPVAASVAAPVHRAAHVLAPVHHEAAVPAPIVHHAAAAARVAAPAPRHVTQTVSQVAPQPVRHASAQAASHTATQPAADTVTQTATAPGSDPGISVNPDTSAGTPVADQEMPNGTRSATPPNGPPQRPTGRWNEHLPGGIGGVLIGHGQADPCTPSGGRIGVAISTIVNHVAGGGRLGF